MKSGSLKFVGYKAQPRSGLAERRLERLISDPVIGNITAELYQTVSFQH